MNLVLHRYISSMQNQQHKKKKDYCLSHNIPLYIIRYQDYNKINADFIKDMVKE